MIPTGRQANGVRGGKAIPGCATGGTIPVDAIDTSEMCVCCASSLSSATASIFWMDALEAALLFGPCATSSSEEVPS